QDEIFHVRQTQAYCRNEFGTWDTKITTFPGVYILGLFWSFFDGCTLEWLRTLNLVFAMLTPGLMYMMLRPRMESVAAVLTSLLLSLWPVHFFYHFMYYTDPASTFFALLTCHLASPGPVGGRRSGGREAGGMVAVLCRQNNVIWVLFALGTAMLRFLLQTKEFQDSLPMPLSLTLVLRFIVIMAKKWKQLLAQFWPLLLPIMGFVVFIFWNDGSVVLGDRAHHAAVFHPAQLGPAAALAAALRGPWDRRDCPLHPVRYLSSTAQKGTALLAFGIAVFLCYNYTLDHPFLLADNRHYTFYLWRRVLGRWPGAAGQALRGALGAPYLAAAAFVLLQL
ncbi:unnamed protein product, partial [Heterosigma akashiwo]